VTIGTHWHISESRVQTECRSSYRSVVPIDYSSHRDMSSLSQEVSPPNSVPPFALVYNRPRLVLALMQRLGTPTLLKLETFRPQWISPRRGFRLPSQSRLVPFFWSRQHFAATSSLRAVFGCRLPPLPCPATSLISPKYPLANPKPNRMARSSAPHRPSGTS
jgi:hypothetical protein